MKDLTVEFTPAVFVLMLPPEHAVLHPQLAEHQPRHALLCLRVGPLHLENTELLGHHLLTPTPGLDRGWQAGRGHAGSDSFLGQFFRAPKFIV